MDSRKPANFASQSDPMASRHTRGESKFEAPGTELQSILEAVIPMRLNALLQQLRTVQHQYEN